MADKIQILIEAILQKTSKENLEKELQKIQNQLKPLEIKADVKDINRELQKFAQTFVQVKDSGEKLRKETEQYKNSLGQIVKEIRNIEEVSDEKGNIQKKVSSTIKTITTDYQKQRQELEKLNAEQSKYWSQRVKETVEGMTRKSDELAKMAEYYKQLEEESAKENMRIFNLGTNLTSKISGFTGVDRESVARYAREIYGANSEITKFNQTMDKNGRILADATVRVNKNAKEYTEYKMKIDSATKSVGQFGEAVNRKTGKDMGIWEQFRVAMERFPVWIASATIIMGAIRQIREGISYISELDNSLNEIRIVTNKTQQEVNNLALSYNKLAKEMSVTTKEVASTAADLFRQGLNDTQVEERMKAIIQYAKISSISLDESNKIITATANATGESAQKIIDIFSYLGDATSSGAEEIGEALQKVASTAENSGVSLEKAASWIATISSVTRESASAIGTSLKSIISRYEQIKSQGFNAEDATQINDVTKALQAVGITAVDVQGQLRPIAEVLDELGVKWDGLTKNEQAYVATTLAG